jgi:hypothetical protein
MQGNLGTPQAMPVIGVLALQTKRLAEYSERLAAARAAQQ